MSNHFTYEIDERNLRTQLKAHTVPADENTWQKFEAYSDSIGSNQRENKFGNFNITLNRNVILPGVFGIIIIIFSFLLVNFVSIKNPSKEKNQKAETNIVDDKDLDVPQQKTEKITALPVVNQTKVIPAEKEKVTTSADSEPIKHESAMAKIDPVKEEKTLVATEESKKEISSVTPSVNSTETRSDSAVISLAEEEAKAKRRAKRRAEAIETQKLLEIRPTPVSEERDSEIRPN